VYVDVAKSGRASLHEAEKEFFLQLVPLAVYISEQSGGKAKWLRHFANPVGMKPSLVMADIIYQSQFGNHPVAQKRCGNKPCNNLALVEPGKYWYGITVYHKGREYRAYRDRETFAVDMSDYLSLSGLFDKVITESNLEAQIRNYAINKRSPNGYCVRIKDLIDQYALTEFDTWPEKRKQTQAL
jgi:hypothetical protein